MVTLSLQDKLDRIQNLYTILYHYALFPISPKKSKTLELLFAPPKKYKAQQLTRCTFCYELLQLLKKKSYITSRYIGKMNLQEIRDV